MKRFVCLVATCAGALVFAAGCSRSDTPPATTSPPATTPAPQAQPAQADPPSTVTAPMPPPDAPKGDSGPKPGQANDHSSPAFKAGGERSPK